jgi:1-acyl-sn-glycerol-3-phosphate acyltransferase
MLAHAATAALILRAVFPRASPDRRRAFVRWWSAKLLSILNVTARIEGSVPAETPGGTMIAANHVSWLDIFLISSVRPTRFIAKSEIREWPIAGWIVERAGTLFIRRGVRREIMRISERVHDALAQGDCVGLFPEGLTSEGDKLLKFHSPLFESAVANRAVVHPAAIRYENADGTLCRDASYVGERTFMESLTLIIGQRSILARVGFAAAIDTEGATRREVTKIAEARIANLLGLEIAGRQPGRAPDRQGAPP